MRQEVLQIKTRFYNQMEKYISIQVQWQAQ